MKYLNDDIDNGELEIIEAANDKASLSDLQNMYSQIFCPAFPNEDERESLENLIKLVQSEQDGITSHILHLKIQSSIAGSMIFSYFHEINAAYIAYIVIDQNHRNKGYATLLFERGMQIARRDSIIINKDPVKYIYIEIDKYEDEIPPSVLLWNRLGFKQLGIEYVQPPLNQKKESSDTLILALRMFGNKNISEISSEEVKLFIKSFFEKSFDISKETKNSYIKIMNDRLDMKHSIQLFNLHELNSTFRGA